MNNPFNNHMMNSTESPNKRIQNSLSVYSDSTSDQSSGLKQALDPMHLPLSNSKSVNQQLRSGQLPSKKTSIHAIDKAFLDNAIRKQEAWIFKKRGEADENNDTSSSITDPYATTLPTASAKDERPDAAEVFRLKKELELANERMAQMDLQLTQSRLAQHTMEEAIGSPFPTAPHLAATIPHQNMLPARNEFQQFRNYEDSTKAFERTTYTLPQQALEHMSCFQRPSSGFGMRPGMQVLPATQSKLHSAFFVPTDVSRSAQAPVGTRLSATASEFDLDSNQFAMQQQPPSSGYVSMTEPLNYRRLLDRNAFCDWKYIIDKIVCNNDQQASIFLQQKLKVATNGAKFDIVQAIINQAYPLIVNRFGNFLVQRCFEHGTPEQVIAIAQTIRGNTLNLSMDAFGCHVVQKAFDCVPEEYKAIMVHELLRRIPETVIHRYACHVWQKLFELRWSDSPPQIMKYVNEALRGMWHEVARGETGSLVVQNIFENCLEEDKRPCISEVLASIDVVAHGQFGNWCIQHICEHGSIPDRSRAIDHVIRFATEYSTDQYASKVVEKCLKIGGNDFLDRYLERVCEARLDRPRMPLIDIAGDQFGNYLIQYILSNSDLQRREVVAAHISKHMVSLRGSKYGSRVAMLCCNPAVATRPGPPASLPNNRHIGSTFGGAERFGSSENVRSSFSVGRSYPGRGSIGGTFR